MIQMKSFLAYACTALLAVTILFGCANNTSVNPKYDIAPAEYEALSEQFLQHIANFEWEKSFAFLAEDVVYKLPDGDTDTRTTIKGLDAVKDFWINYPQKSGNDKAEFKNFVHIPVQVNEMIEHVGVTGVFDMCYFSAALHYGEKTANVRMHWALHFNEAKKIDGIYSYYDRTPIIETANTNFLSGNGAAIGQAEGQVVQIVKLKSGLPEAELIKIAKERAEKFRAVPGLVQKYYIRLGQPGEYSGVYIWDSKASMQAFKESELAATIAQAYKTLEAPKVEVSDMLFQLRE